VLGSIPFNIFIRDLEDGADVLSRLAETQNWEK